MGFASVFRGDVRASPAETPQIAGQFDGDHILVPLLTSHAPVVTDQLRVAATLARRTDASLQVIKPITALDRATEEYRREVTDEDEQELVDWAVEQVSTSRGDDGFLSTPGLVRGIRRIIAADDVDTLVVPGTSSTGFLRRGITDRLAAHADCDVITVNGRAGYEEVASILLPIAGGPHSGLATDVAQRIAANCDAWIDILHVVDEEASDHQREIVDAYMEAAYRRIARPETTTTWVLEAADATDAIIDQSAYYGLTIIGAPTKGRLRQFVSGSTNRSIRQHAQSLILSARSNSTAHINDSK
jgi:nucleotide-binding universal stress UspA family protein